MKLSIIKINKNNKILIDEFLQVAGKSLETFRYFDSRDISVIENHKLTIIGQKDRKSIAYGHLDEDHGKVWLGIAVAHDYKGEGYGYEILNYLLLASIKLKIKEIFLSVDRSNKTAITLYEKNNFIKYKEDFKVLYFKRSNPFS